MTVIRRNKKSLEYSRFNFERIKIEEDKCLICNRKLIIGGSKNRGNQKTKYFVCLTCIKKRNSENLKEDKVSECVLCGLKFSSFQFLLHLERHKIC